MAITYISPSALSGTTDSTTLNITLPTVQAGDVMLLEYVHRGATAGTLGGVGGSGWNNKLSRDFATATFSAHLYWKRCDGSESGDALTVTGLTNSCAGCVTVYRGVKSTGDPFEAATAEDNASADESHAAITTTTPGAWVGLTVGNSPDVAVTSPSTTSPGALTQRAERLNTTGTDTSICSNSAEKATAGSTGALTWSVSPNGPSASFAWALTPELLATPTESLKVGDVIVNVLLTVLLATVPSEVVKITDEVQAQLVNQDLLASTTEGVKVGASGFAEMVQFAELVKIGDGPAVGELVTDTGDLSRNIPAESLRVIDDPVLATRDLSRDVTAESLRVIDGPVEPAIAGNDLVRSLTESVKVGASGFAEMVQFAELVRISDGPVSAQLFALGDLEVSKTESLRISDIGWAEIGIDETLKVADAITVAIDPEQASPSESLKVVDTVTVSINPEQASLSESLKVVDQLLGPTIDPEQTALTESLKVVDTVTVSLNPEQASPSESLKVVDQILGPTLDPEQTAFTELLKVVDVVVVTLDPEQAAFSESLKVVDTVVVFINPEQATPSESLKVVDEISVARIDAGSLTVTLDEIYKVSDVPNLTLNPEQATATESLKVVDAVSATIAEANLAVSLSESLKVADEGEVEFVKDETIRIVEQLTVVLGGALTTSLSESLKVSDTISASLNQLSVSLSESLKVDDSGQAELVQFESIRISDVLLAEMQTPTDLYATVATESLKVVDAVSAAIQLAVAISTESLKVVDTLSSPWLDPIQTIVTEALKVVDQNPPTVAEASTLLVNLVESLKVVDSTPVGRLNPIQVSVAEEVLQVVDSTPVGRLNPLQIAISESLKVVDGPPIPASGTTLVANPTEIVKVVDTALTTLDPEETSRTESLKVVDALSITLDPEQAALSELLGVADSLTVALSHLEVTLTESLKVADLQPRFGGPAIIDSTGSYITVIDSVGSYVTTIDIVGEYL